MPRAGIVAFLAALGLAQAAHAQPAPADRAREAAAMLTAAGFQVTTNDIRNPCGRSVRPRPAAVDMNGDGRPEAVIVDADPTCYGPAGEAFTIIQRQASGQWTKVAMTYGRLKLLETRTSGWRDYTLEGPGCQRTWTFQPGQGYVSLKACPEAGGRAAKELPTTPAAKAGGGMMLDERPQALRAGGFTPNRAGRFLACDPRQDLEVETRDLNGDGRPDAVITNFGLECFGNTGQGFVLVTKDASGAWRKLFESPGIPEFLSTRGVGGWPDIVNGGPGFCFPVMRWNGRDYAIVRWKEQQRGACAGRRVP